MGWTIPYDTYEKHQIIEDCTRGGPNSRCIAKSCSGNELWTVWEDKEGKRFIVLFLLRKYDGRWGYKDMDESMHPYFYNCPQKFLDMTPVVRQEWRDEVKKYKTQVQARRAMLKRVKVGSVVKCERSRPDMFVVTNLVPLTGRALNGAYYKIPKRRISEIVKDSDMTRVIN
jgi:hypothetical protein